jgi:hypothetical protein
MNQKAQPPIATGFQAKPKREIRNKRTILTRGPFFIAISLSIKIFITISLSIKIKIKRRIVVLLSQS